MEANSFTLATVGISNSPPSPKNAGEGSFLSRTRGRPHDDRRRAVQAACQTKIHRLEAPDGDDRWRYERENFRRSFHKRVGERLLPRVSSADDACPEEPVSSLAECIAT